MKKITHESWLNEFRDRMASFGAGTSSDVVPVSIKLRVESGCFCRNCCPEGHQLVEDYLRKNQSSLDKERVHIIEHESGPEILASLSFAAGVTSLVTSVVNLIIAIIQARSAGIRRGDKGGDPFRLIVRRTDERNQLQEEFIMEIPSSIEVDFDGLSKRFIDGAERIKGHAGNERRKREDGQNKRK